MLDAEMQALNETIVIDLERLIKLASLSDQPLLAYLLEMALSEVREECQKKASPQLGFGASNVSILRRPKT